MKILHICAYTWSIGGPARVIYDHAAVAVAQGHQIDILSPLSPGDTLYPAPDGARVFPMYRTPPISRFFREFSVDLYRFLKAHLHDYDLVHCHGLWHFGSIAPFLLDKRVAKVVTIHGVLDRWAVQHNQWKKTIMDVLMQKRLLERADLIHLISPDEQDDLLRYLGHRHPRVVLIPNGIPTADFAQLPPRGTFRQQFGLTAEQPMILFMSRLHVKKGLDILLDGFAQYARQHPDTQLVLAGPDDSYQATAEAFIREHQLGNQVKVVGMLTGEAKKAALADADLFVLPSYSEGFSMAVLEAMAAGVACLVSDRVGFEQAIRETNAACLTDTTAGAVAQNLDKVLSDATYRRQIAQNGQQLVRQRYDINTVARQLLAAYESVLAPRTYLTNP
ncbi:glycosyltransferase [Fibrella sp. WM1]|uniref:glycosyltransferase n=1 Tax=Fibrella musci TaxID=3242485 RepID=UPI0035210ED1